MTGRYVPTWPSQTFLSAQRGLPKRFSYRPRASNYHSLRNNALLAATRVYDRTISVKPTGFQYIEVSGELAHLLPGDGSPQELEFRHPIHDSTDIPRKQQSRRERRQARQRRWRQRGLVHLGHWRVSSHHTQIVIRSGGGSGLTEYEHAEAVAVGRSCATTNN